MAHIPKEVIAKNFQTTIAAWDHIPDEELYIFPSGAHSKFTKTSFRWADVVRLAPPADDQQPPISPYGSPPNPFTFEFSKVPVIQRPGGTIKVADSRTFKVATSIAVAEVTVEPGAMRELHVSYPHKTISHTCFSTFSRAQWHPTQDEWAFFL